MGDKKDSSGFKGLDQSEINYKVAEAFNSIRGTKLNEDDVHFIIELEKLIWSHYRGS